MRRADEGWKTQMSTYVVDAASQAVHHPEAAAVNARRAAEVICQVELDEGIAGGAIRRPDREPVGLGQLLRLVESRLTPGLIAQLQVIKIFGNEGAHPGAALSFDEVLPCLLALRQAITTYFREVAQSPIPEEIEGKLDFARPKQTPEDDLTIRISSNSAITVAFRLCETFGDLLDVVWVALDPMPAPFSYGHTWVLRTRSGMDIKGARVITGIAPGTAVADNRTLDEVGVRPGDQLSVVRLKDAPSGRPTF